MSANSAEAKAFERYRVLFEDIERIKEDISVLDAEMKKEGVEFLAVIKRLASLTARDVVAQEENKLRLLRSVAERIGQLELFRE